MKLILQFCLLFFAGSLPSQIITVSEPIVMRNDIAYYILGEQESNVLFFRDRQSSFEVQAFDKGMRVKWEKEIELDRGRPEIFDVVPGKGDFEVIYKHRRKGKQYLKIHRYDAAANLIDSTTVKKLGSAFFSPKFEMKLSENKRKMLLVDYDRVSKFNATVINLDSMKIIWEKAFTSDNFFPIRELKDFLVDNQGNAHMIFDKGNRKISRENHKLEIFSHGPDFKNTDKIVLPLPNLNYDIDFRIDNLNNRFISAGLYSEKNKGKANGYFYLNADLSTGKLIKLSYHSFSDKQVSVLADKAVENNEGIPEMKTQAIVLRRDGGILLIAEQVKLNERTGNNMSRMDRYGNYIVDYYYDNVFVASIHPNGELHWDEILHKRQFSQDDDASYSSYFLMKTPRNLRLIFNDEIRNENLVSEYVISPSGTADRNSVFNTESQSLKLRFRDAIQVSGNEIIVPSERKNRVKLVRVTY